MSVKLYQPATFLGYRRNRLNQDVTTALVEIEGVSKRTEATFYLGKRICYVYDAKASTKGKKSTRTIWGRVQAVHGNKGVVRCTFTKNLPPRAMGSRVRVMLFPNRA